MDFSSGKGLVLGGLHCRGRHDGVSEVCLSHGHVAGSGPSLTDRTGTLQDGFPCPFVIDVSSCAFLLLLLLLSSPLGHHLSSCA